MQLLFSPNQFFNGFFYFKSNITVFQSFLYARNIEIVGVSDSNSEIS